MTNRMFALLVLAGIGAVHWGSIKHRALLSWMLAGSLLVVHRRPIKMLGKDVLRLADDLLAKSERKTEDVH